MFRKNIQGLNFLFLNFILFFSCLVKYWDASTLKLRCFSDHIRVAQSVSGENGFHLCKQTSTEICSTQGSFSGWPVSFRRHIFTPNSSNGPYYVWCKNGWVGKVSKRNNIVYKKSACKKSYIISLVNRNIYTLALQTHTHKHTHTHTHTHTYIYIYIRIYIHVYVYMYVSMQIYLSIYVHACVSK